MRTAVNPPPDDATTRAANVTVIVAAGADEATENTVAWSRLTAFPASPCCLGSVAGV
jgi:hypothetical protein